MAQPLHATSADRTAWFRAARWGVCLHFLHDIPGSRESDNAITSDSVEAWNRRVDAFDVAGLARQLHALKAGYLLITLGQNSGYFLSPNSAYERLVPRVHSPLSRRDLVADLITALTPLGIRVLVYLPSHAPARDREAVERLGFTPDWDAHQTGIRPGAYLRAPGTDPRLTRFQRNWEQIIAEWSRRWGRSVSGWWFDGAYYADQLYRSADEPNSRSFAAAARAGNPDSLLAFNGGVSDVAITAWLPDADYTAGEMSDKLYALGRYDWCAKLAPTIDGTQLHLFTHLAATWGHHDPRPRFPAAFVSGYTRMVNDLGGVMTWDTPFTPEGLIAPECFSVLQSINA